MISFNLLKSLHPAARERMRHFGRERLGRSIMDATQRGEILNLPSKG
jgi:hypothetical protein